MFALFGKYGNCNSSYSKSCQLIIYMYVIKLESSPTVEKIQFKINVYFLSIVWQELIIPSDNKTLEGCVREWYHSAL